MSDTPKTDYLEKQLSNAAHPSAMRFCRELERENAELKAEILRAELLVLQGSSGFERENAELRSWIAKAAPMYANLVCYLIDKQGITNWPECMDGCQGLLEMCPLSVDQWEGGEG
jgi:hypothetical protein